jgi:arabinofuranan 3-O-arabinosyltransferase
VTLDEPVRGRTLRVTVTETTAKPEETANARFTEIDAGPSLTVDGPRTCLPVATVDGQPLAMRPASGAGVALADSNGAPWVTCEDVDLAWGEHELRPVDGIQLDSVALRDVQGLEEEPLVPAPTSQVELGPGGQATVQAGASSSPYAVILGQGYDPRWRATIDGEDAGPPVQLDGYSVGWIIEDPEQPHEIAMTFGPQRVATVAALLSSTVFLVICYLFGASLLARRRGASPAVAEPVTEDTEQVVADGEHEGGRRRSVLRWLLIVAVATFAAGPAGLVASLLAWGLTRLRSVRPVRLIDLGVVLVVLSALVYVIGPGRTGGIVDADAIAASMWPHWIAGAGLVLAVTGALLRLEVTAEPPEELKENSA